MKLIRIAIPTLNSAATLGPTLESLRHLRDRAEVVLVDSGSTDDTLEIARQHACDIRHEPPGNMYAAINAGLRDASTDWLTYLNSDDLLYPETTLRRLAAVGNGCDVLYGTVDFVDAEGRFLRSWRPAKPSSLLRLFRAGYSPMLQQGTLFRREVFAGLGGFSTGYRYVSDADFWWRALGDGAVFQREPGCATVAAFRLHPSQATQRHAATMLDEHALMHRRYADAASKSAAMFSMLSWRLENFGSYAERWLRARRLGLRPVFCRSYDLPRR
jgi:glycosyltransferase involved in cell wall biosynthesis